MANNTNNITLEEFINSLINNNTENDKSYNKNDKRYLLAPLLSYYHQITQDDTARILRNSVSHYYHNNTNDNTTVYNLLTKIKEDDKINNQFVNIAYNKIIADYTYKNGNFYSKQNMFSINNSNIQVKVQKSKKVKIKTDDENKTNPTHNANITKPIHEFFVVFTKYENNIKHEYKVPAIIVKNNQQEISENLQYILKNKENFNLVVDIVKDIEKIATEKKLTKENTKKPIIINFKKPTEPTNKKQTLDIKTTEDAITAIYKAKNQYTQDKNNLEWYVKKINENQKANKYVTTIEEFRLKLSNRIIFTFKDIHFFKDSIYNNKKNPLSNLIKYLEFLSKKTVNKEWENPLLENILEAYKIDEITINLKNKDEIKQAKRDLPKLKNYIDEIINNNYTYGSNFIKQILLFEKTFFDENKKNNKDYVDFEDESLKRDNNQNPILQQYLPKDRNLKDLFFNNREGLKKLRNSALHFNQPKALSNYPEVEKFVDFYTQEHKIICNTLNLSKENKEKITLLQQLAISIKQYTNINSNIATKIKDLFSQKEDTNSNNHSKGNSQATTGTATNNTNTSKNNNHRHKKNNFKRQANSQSHHNQKNLTIEYLASSINNSRLK